MTDILQYRRAFALCMTGGNQLTSALALNLGPDFAEDFSPYTDPDRVFAALRDADMLGPGHVFYDIWCCWAAIMQARELIK